jgi:dynein heavy chain 1
MEGTLRESYKGNGIVLSLNYDEYEKRVRGPTQDIFVMFDASFTSFSEFFLDQGRMRRRAGEARNETPAQVLKGIKLYHQALRERLDAIYHFRTQHEKLRTVVAEVLTGERKTGPGGDDSGSSEEYSAWALKEVDEAPLSLFASVDVLDLSARGEAVFAAALDGYDRKVDAIEEHLAKLLRDKLSSCQDAEDMFRVFARFNPLLSRTRVRVAVKEFQLQLMNTVGQAVQKLQSKFTHKYESSSASCIATIRGIPPVSGKILWAKQMERQVHALMKRMSHVLGKEWGQHLEGRQLRRSCDELLSKLDSRAYFRNWVSEWERELSSDTNSKLNTFPIIIVREGKFLVAKTNFDEKHEYLSREIRYLKWLGYERDIPRTIALVSEEAMTRHAHASKFMFIGSVLYLSLFIHV